MPHLDPIAEFACMFIIPRNCSIPERIQRSSGVSAPGVLDIFSIVANARAQYRHDKVARIRVLTFR
jgi:hypothetical protein